MEAKKLTRCPYTLRPITELSEISREHIILDALGGPDGYSVEACRSENSKLGNSIDAAFLENPLIQMYRSKAGVKSRSGISAWKLDGKTVEGNRPVNVSFPHEGPVKVYHKKPVYKAGDTFTIVAPPAQSDALLKQFEEKLKKGGRQISRIHTKQSKNQKIKVELSINLTEIQSGLMKIAYLACCDFLGDDFLDDPLNSEWQKAIRARTDKDLKNIKIRRFGLSDFGAAKLIFPELAENEHCIGIFNLNQSYPIVAVRLFGDPMLSIVAFASESSNYGLNEGDGQLLICDSKSGKIRKTSWIDHVLAISGAKPHQQEKTTSG